MLNFQYKEKNISTKTLESNIGQIPGVHANPRTITKDEYQKLKSSIERNGIIKARSPIVYEHEGRFVVICGNMRLKAAKELGLTDIPVFLIDEELTPEQLNELDIIDNKLNGEWDWDSLANEWPQESLEEWGLDTSQEWDNKKELPDNIDETPEPPKTPISKLGDLWLLGDHRVLCGDSTDRATVERLMNGKKADMVFTDPPYNVDYTGKTKQKLKIENDKFESQDSFLSFLSDAFTNMYHASKDGAPYYITHADSEGLNFRLALQQTGYLLKQCLIWNKNTLVMGRQDYQWKHEPILYGWKPGTHKWYGDRKQTTVIDIDKPSRSEDHPTMKPIELITALLRNSTKKNDLILDPFLGSGSTLIAAEQTNRYCYGMELDPQYVDVICKRYQTLTGTMPILESTGEAHDFSS